MLPCGRSCTARQLNQLPIASEPLWFLYPRWSWDSQLQRRHLHNRELPRLHCAPRHSGNKPTPLLNNETAKRSLSRRDRATGTTREIGKENGGVVDGQGLDKDERAVPKGQFAKDKVNFRRTSSDWHVNENEHGDQISLPQRRLAAFVPQKLDTFKIAQELLRVSTVASRVQRRGMPVDGAFLEWLTGTSETNMWMQDRCRVLVTASNGQADVKEVIFEAPESSYQVAKLWFDEQLRVFAQSKDGDGAVLGPGNIKAKPPSYNPKTVEDIQKPAEWSIRSFYRYVCEITSCRQPRLVNRLLYPGRDSYDKAVAKSLGELFTSVMFQRHLSVAALRLALCFLERRTHLAAVARDIWNAAWRAGLIPDIHCFNMEIQRCLSIGNSVRINYLLHSMTKIGLSPDGKTWFLLLQHVKDPTLQSSILTFLTSSTQFKSLPQQNFVARAVLRSMLEEGKTVPNGLEKALVNRIANSMDDQFGSDWLSPTLLAEGLKQTMSFGRQCIMSEFLKLTQARNVELDDESYLFVLDATRRTQNLKDVLTLLHTSHAQKDDLARQTKISLAFKLAWRLDQINVCRVLWRFAASHGIITYDMQKLVQDSLAQNAHPESSKATSQNPKPTMAAAALGVQDAQQESQRQAFPQLLQEKKIDGTLPSSPASFLLRWTPAEGEARSEQMKLAHALLEADLTAWTRYKRQNYPMFLRALRQAHRLDRTWQSSKFIQTASPVELLEQVIEVKMHRRRVPLLPSHKSSSSAALMADPPFDTVTTPRPINGKDDIKSSTPKEGPEFKKTFENKNKDSLVQS